MASATGRYITLDLDDGRRVRYLHLSRYANAFGGSRVGRGQIIAYSGASGYGSEYFGATGTAGIPANTGGPHVHVTLWAGHYYRFGRYPLEPTLDFERYVGGGSAAGEGTPLEDDMSQADVDWIKKKLDDIANAISDPKIGILGAANAARDHAAQADRELDEVIAKIDNAANISSDVRNWITDPNKGVIASIGRVSGGDVDVEALAASLKGALAPAIVAELGKKLIA